MFKDITKINQDDRLIKKQRFYENIEKKRD